MKKDSRTIRMMGTVIDLTVTHPHPQKTLDEVIHLLEMYEDRFSANDPSSELSEINKNAGIRPVKVHPELYELIKIGKEHSQAEDSFLNIAIGPLIQTWRIGFSDAQVPTDEEIKKKLEIIDVNQVLLKENSVYLKRKGMAIDLGALAKGYIADRIIDYLKSVGAQSALINLGGNLVTMGPALHHADQAWRIGIQNPVYERGNSQILLKTNDQSVVTSGIYERQLTENGQTFHHIFNSKTGYPIETTIASLTIISDLSLDGEIWTTRLFGQTEDKIIATINQLPHIEGIVINKQGQTLYSEGSKKLIV